MNKIITQATGSLKPVLGKEVLKTEKIKSLSDRIFSEIPSDVLNKEPIKNTTQFEPDSFTQENKASKNKFVDTILTEANHYARAHQEAANEQVQGKRESEKKKIKAERTKTSTSVWLPESVMGDLMYLNARQYKFSKLRIGLADLCLFAVKYLNQLPDQKVAELMAEFNTDQRRNRNKSD